MLTSVSVRREPGTPKSFAEFLLSWRGCIFVDEILSYGTTVWSMHKGAETSDGDVLKIRICIQEEEQYFHNVWSGEVQFNKATMSYKDVTLKEKYGNGDVELSRLIDPKFSPFFSVNTEFTEEEMVEEEELPELLTPEQRTEFNEKWVLTQTPIFRRLIDENPCFSGFEIVSAAQYVGIEKMYVPQGRPPFWVYIEIEDAETFEDATCYEVWFNNHENSWCPSKEEEECEGQPIKHVYLSLDEVRNMIETLDQGDFKVLEVEPEML